MGGRNLKFAAVLQINSRARAFANKSSGASESAVRRVINKAEKLAKANVEPGKGPGPHPHIWPHKDTWNLWKSIKSAIWLQGFLTEGSVYTELEYGTYLEVGWHRRTKAGRGFYRYPWLRPAMLEALKLLPKYAAEAFRTQMQDLDEDQIVKDAELDSWASAAERWANDMQGLRGKSAPPEIPPPYKPSFTPIGRGIHKHAERKKGGRPKDTSELADDLPKSRRRVRGSGDERLSQNVERFDTKQARKTKRSGEHTSRSQIDAAQAQAQYEARQRERQQQIAERARARQERARRKLETANADLQERMHITPSKKRKRKK